MTFPSVSLNVTSWPTPGIAVLGIAIDPPAFTIAASASPEAVEQAGENFILNSPITATSSGFEAVIDLPRREAQ